MLQTKFCERTKEAPGRISEWEGKETSPTIRLYPFQPQLGPVGSPGRERSHSLFVFQVECSLSISEAADCYLTPSEAGGRQRVGVRAQKAGNARWMSVGLWLLKLFN